MDTKALRQKILDLAIRGKLVPQDPNDEPASVLLERIRAQKQQMVREGKLKSKDIKDDTVIFVGEDNLHYEKLPDGSVKCIEDEIPFDLPESWAWCRIKNICTIGTGATPLKSNSAYYANGTIPWITSAATSEEIITTPADYITERAITETNCSIYPIGTLIIAMYGEGKTRGQISELGIEACTNQACAALQILADDVRLSQYVKSYFQYSYENLRQKAKGGQQPNLNQTIIAETLIAIPPYQETKRIMDSVYQCIDQINTIEEGIGSICTSIENAKKRILDLAIHGQLVPQNSADEPATVLLDRIRAEKEELIRQGKIKRDKKESVIFRGDDNSYYEHIDSETFDITEEIPFSLPDSWRWVRISQLFEINPRNRLGDDMEVSFIPMPLIEDGFSGKHGSEIRKWKEVKSGFTHFAEGDIGIAKITPCFENRKSVIFQNLHNGYGAGTTELHVLRPLANCLNAEYALAFFKTEAFIQNGVQEFTGAVGQQRIGKDYITETLFPLPPYKEQERIENRIKAIFTLINQIETSLA